MLGACLAMAKSHDEDAGRGLGYGGVGVGGESCYQGNGKRRMQLNHSPERRIIFIKDSEDLTV